MRKYPIPWGDFGVPPFNQFGFYARPFSDVALEDFVDGGVFGQPSLRSSRSRGRKMSCEEGSPQHNNGTSFGHRKRFPAWMRNLNSKTKHGTRNCKDAEQEDESDCKHGRESAEMESKHEPLYGNLTHAEEQQQQHNLGAHDSGDDQKECSDFDNFQSGGPGTPSTKDIDDFEHLDEWQPTEREQKECSTDSWEDIDCARRRRWSWESVAPSLTSDSLETREDFRDDAHDTSVYRGLPNPRNYLCYANSVLVWMTNEPAFQALLKDVKNPGKCQVLTVKIFSHLLKHGSVTSEIASNPVEGLVQELEFPVGSQECSSDFLGRMLNQIIYEESENRERDPKASLFEWKFVSTLYSQDHPEGNSHLEVLTQIPMCDYYSTLETAISKFSNASEYVEYQGKKSIKSRSPIDVPDCAIFTLRFRTQHRIRPAMTNEELRIRRTQIENAAARGDFDLVAVLLDTLEGQQKTEFVVEKNARRMSFPAELNPLNPAKPATHFLSAVVAHIGKSGQGHYVSYIRDFADDIRWRKMDNEKLSWVTWRGIQNRTFGGQDNMQEVATILVYRHY